MRWKLGVLLMPFVVTLFLPIALIGLLASVNEYQDQGIANAVDCDGPLTVMLFVVPSVVVYTAGAIYYAVLLKGRGRRLPAAVLMVLCLGMASATGVKAGAAYREKIRPDHQQTCGGGW